MCETHTICLTRYNAQKQNQERNKTMQAYIEEIKAKIANHATQSTKLILPDGTTKVTTRFITKGERKEVFKLYAQLFAARHGSKDKKDIDSLVKLQSANMKSAYLTHKDIVNFLDCIGVDDGLPEESPFGDDDWDENSEWVKTSFGYVY